MERRTEDRQSPLHASRAAALRLLVGQAGNQGGPARPVAAAQSHAVIAVEMLMERRRCTLDVDRGLRGVLRGDLFSVKLSVQGA